MLTHIKLQNFKAFHSLELSCAPLTLLCGLNGAGKSSVFQSLLVFRQSARSGALGRSPPRIDLNGPLVEVGTIEDARHEEAGSDLLRFEWASRTNSEQGQFLGMSFRQPNEQDVRGDQLVAVHDGVQDVEPDRGWANFLLSSWSNIPPLGGDMHHVDAERIGPRKWHHRSETRARRQLLGSHGEYALNFLSEEAEAEKLPLGDPRADGVQSRKRLDIANRWLEQVSPGARININNTIVQADALVSGFSFERRDDVATRSFRATNVGFGLSYVLPVVAALLVRPGALCLIENPEAHLHPRGQSRLAGLFVQAARAGVQVLVETHSDHFLDGVRLAVRDGQIRPNQVAIHYFERDGARVSVTSPEVGADGRLSHWPEGFFDQHEENLARLLAPKG